MTGGTPSDERVLAGVMRKLLAAINDGEYGGIGSSMGLDSFTTTFVVDTGVAITDEELEVLMRQLS